MLRGRVIPRRTSSIGKPVLGGAGAATATLGVSGSPIVLGASGFSAVPVMSFGGGSSVICTAEPSPADGVADPAVALGAAGDVFAVLVAVAGVFAVLAGAPES